MCSLFEILVICINITGLPEHKDTTCDLCKDITSWLQRAIRHWRLIHSCNNEYCIGFKLDSRFVCFQKCNKLEQSFGVWVFFLVQLFKSFEFHFSFWAVCCGWSWILWKKSIFAMDFHQIHILFVLFVVTIYNLVQQPLSHALQNGKVILAERI
jgi:hypothetical protein